jgi:hypothetical protein
MNETNEPANNSAVRINPDTGDAIVVLVAGGTPLASILGSQWVYWQTGLPDVISIPTDLRRIVPALLSCSLVCW